MPGSRRQHTAALSWETHCVGSRLIGNAAYRATERIDRFQQKIGIGLTDHPAFFSNSYELASGSPFAGFENHAKVLMFHKQASDTQHPYNVELLINPKYWDVGHADDDLWRQEVGSDQRTWCGCSSSSPAPSMMATKSPIGEKARNWAFTSIAMGPDHTCSMKCAMSVMLC
jgi:hypothetical protein